MGSSYHVKFVALDKDIITPKHNNEYDAGVEIRSNEDIEIFRNQIRAISTGLKVEIPKGTYLEIRPVPRSQSIYGIELWNNPTIDPSYRDEIKVILTNLSGESLKIEKGMKIARMVLTEHIKQHWIAVTKLQDPEI